MSTPPSIMDYYPAMDYHRAAPFDGIAYDVHTASVPAVAPSTLTDFGGFDFDFFNESDMLAALAAPQFQSGFDGSGSNGNYLAEATLGSEFASLFTPEATASPPVLDPQFVASFTAGSASGSASPPTTGTEHALCTTDISATSWPRLPPAPPSSPPDPAATLVPSKKRKTRDEVDLANVLHTRRPRKTPKRADA